MDPNFKITTQIEKLKFEASAWQMINLGHELPYRTYQITSSLNKHEIVILGGKYQKNEEPDIWLLDVRSDTAQ